MNWILVPLQWYAVLFLLGIIFFPLCRLIFGRFFDQGYAFSKTLAILVLSYVAFAGGTIKLLPFQPIVLWITLILFILLNTFLFFRKQKELPLPSIPVLIFEELFFLGSFFFLTYVRGQEPSIRGLEKFMDFGFMNSILRSTYFPPLDMWYTREPINYYYFGHLTGSYLIKLTGVSPFIGYNLILATIFAQAMVITCSLTGQLVYFAGQKLGKHYAAPYFIPLAYGLLASFVVQLGGNLHTVYLFTKGYQPDQPLPFWQILQGFNPTAYWYPNATRFIPFTIHEFPSYSYVVADLHGHVFDIPFVLLTLALILLLYVHAKHLHEEHSHNPLDRYSLFLVAGIGIMTGIHYMTNALDGPIYLLLAFFSFFLIWGISRAFFITAGTVVAGFILTSLPFTLHFHPFVNGVGVNCSPEKLTDIGKIGPFLFEAGKCQVSPFWMLFVLWGFFWIMFLLFTITVWFNLKKNQGTHKVVQIDFFVICLFIIGTILTLTAEFFYVKDIYPQHFRANTMFKLGYQAFMMMGIGSVYAFYRFRSLPQYLYLLFKVIFLVLFFFLFLYPFFSFPSYYGSLKKTPQLNGELWLDTMYPEDRQIIDYLNLREPGQPTILESQGDSYTDHERISANTGLPTVAGWLVHEWLWRGSPDVVGKRVPDIEKIYQSENIDEVKALLKKYKVKYVIVSSLERSRYLTLKEDKFLQIGRLVFQSSNKKGAIYQVDR